MNKAAIEKFAVWARTKFISEITYKMGLLGITENGIAEPLPQSTNDLQLFDIGTKNYAEVTGIAIKQRSALVDEIKRREKTSNYNTALTSVIEEVAYTWFNRLVAVRFMEVNGYLPSGVRVLSSENSAKSEPDLVTNPFDTDLEFTPFEQDRIIQLKDENKLDELFRMLFIKQCNKFHDILPELFEKTDDYTELLLTISFTDKDGVVYHLTHDIPESNFNVEQEGQVEIIGWMYQYYNTELKADTFAQLKKNVKITKERIPAATQLFTPDWIVRYMVENSLGRLWIEGHPNDSLKNEWKYYLQMAKKNGYQAMITQHSWMFLSSFEKLRAKLLSVDIVNMAHLGARAFEEIGGEVVQTTSFVIRKSHVVDYKGEYCRLIEPTTQQGKEDMFLAGENRYTADQSNFSKIPGSPVAYWVSDNVLKCYKAKDIYNYAKPCKGIDTGDNNRFLRLWFEVENSKKFTPVGVPVTEVDFETYKWFPYNKGGEFRKWYGNNEYLLNWEYSGQVLRNFKGSNLRNKDYYFKNGITWSTITSGDGSFRYFDYGFLFDNGGSCLFAGSRLLYIQGLLNSIVSKEMLSIQPTINNQPGTIGSIPLLLSGDMESVEDIVRQNIDISHHDWDSFETSWDFQHHPLLRKVHTIAEAFDQWQNECDNRFNKLKVNEEELNRIFIDIYGLQDELTPEVEDKDVTVRKADLQRDIKSLISYAVGCMFGRYSLDTEGIAYAGGDWDTGKYETFIPDTDNCIPITDEEYFEDDIVGLFCAWLKKVYGDDSLEQNLDFIAKALGNKGTTSREVIRNYFLNDFIKDHIKTYQKRPIYWMFDSGKQNGFKALCYMHRWNADTTGNMRVEYLHRMQRVYESEINRMQETIDNSTNNREVSAAEKRKDKLTKQLKETKDYDAKVAHLALSRIDIDLDDGVKVNYEKVQTADGKKMQILAKI